jgi:hypothetical protein
MKYRHTATEKFWKQFNALPASQQASARAAFQIFKLDPFDPRLRTHKIHRLSAVFSRTVHAVVIEGDLRSAFFLDGETIVSFAIGTHDIYKR